MEDERKHVRTRYTLMYHIWESMVKCKKGQAITSFSNSLKDRKMRPQGTYFKFRVLLLAWKIFSECLEKDVLPTRYNTYLLRNFAELVKKK